MGKGLEHGPGKSERASTADREPHPCINTSVVPTGILCVCVPRTCNKTILKVAEGAVPWPGGWVGCSALIARPDARYPR